MKVETIVMSIMDEPVNEIYVCGLIQFITIVSFRLRSSGSDDWAVLGEKLQSKMKHWARALHIYLCVDWSLHDELEETGFTENMKCLDL